MEGPTLRQTPDRHTAGVESPFHRWESWGHQKSSHPPRPYGLQEVELSFEGRLPDSRDPLTTE